MKIDISSLVDNNPRIKELKKQAKILLRQIKTNIKPDVSLRACQDLVAQQHGYKHWYEFHTEIKKNYEVKQNEIKNYFYKTLPDPQKHFNYGYSVDMGLHYCLEESDRLKHTLILGENREKINFHFAKQAIKANETLVFMDGSGQNNSSLELFNFARQNNRENDLFVINFMADANPFFKNKLSNTFNPLSKGSSGSLIEFIVSLMDKDDNIMWKGRAIYLISAIIMALVYMRDNEHFDLNFSSLHEYLSLDKIIDLYKTRTDFPIHIKNALKGYLFSLPAFKEGSIRQTETVLDQHGFLQMQFTRILGFLTDSYGYIFNSIPEIDLENFTAQNKKAIILIQFPCFEKISNELKILSYFMLNMLRQQLNFALKSPPLSNISWIINDCPVNLGFSVVLAQARANHVSLLFSYKDTTFNQSDNNEAISLAANCNIKINMNSPTNYELQYQGMKYDLNIL